MFFIDRRARTIVLKCSIYKAFIVTLIINTASDYNVLCYSTLIFTILFWNSMNTDVWFKFMNNFNYYV